MPGPVVLFRMLQILCSIAVRPFALLCAVLSLAELFFFPSLDGQRRLGICPQSLSLSVRMHTVLEFISHTFRIIYSTCCCDFAMDVEQSSGRARLRPGNYLEPNAVLWTWLLKRHRRVASV